MTDFDVTDSVESESGIVRNNGEVEMRAETSVSIIDCLFLNNQQENDNDNNMTSTESKSTSKTDTASSSSDYCPTPLKKVFISPVDLANSIPLCQTAQLQQLIEQINETSVCYTPHCTGKLVPINVKTLGLRRYAVVKFSCSNCGEQMINLVSSIDVAFFWCMACIIVL